MLSVLLWWWMLLLLWWWWRWMLVVDVGGRSRYHFQRALAINSGSSVLHCYLGLVQAAMQRLDASLVSLDNALAIPPANPMAQCGRSPYRLHTPSLQPLLRLLLPALLPLLLRWTTIASCAAPTRRKVHA